jgi:hypothetical protein
VTPGGDYGDRLKEYVPVDQRLRELKRRYPASSLRPADDKHPFRVVELAGVTFIAYTAACYRWPGDTDPGIGSAWEPFPGRTPYTKDSELQNAETSAWGRAIVAALAADTRAGVASLEEIAAREAQPPSQPPTTTQRRPPPSAAPGGPVTADESPLDGSIQPSGAARPGPMTAAQRRELNTRLRDLGRAERLALVRQILGRQVVNASQLNTVDTAQVLAELTLRESQSAGVSTDSHKEDEGPSERELGEDATPFEEAP